MRRKLCLHTVLHTDRFYFYFFNANALTNELITLYSKQIEGLFSGSGATPVLKNLFKNDLSDVLPQSYKLFQLIATIPATTICLWSVAFRA